MKIGIDFDNTLAGYDRLFHNIAVGKGWLLPQDHISKNEIRDTIRRLDDGETKWRTLQAVAYGKRMAEAELIPGAADFLRQCRQDGHEVIIVSHKTQYAAADTDRIDLRQAALGWMDRQGFFSATGFGLSRQKVFFEDSLVGKCQRISESRCGIFIDHLEEVLTDPCFPQQVDRILFHPQSTSPPKGPFRILTGWDSIRHDVFGS